MPMIIRKSKEPMNQVMRSVLVRGDVSDAAKVLFGYIYSLGDGEYLSRKVLLEVFDIKQPVLTSRFRELKKAGLVLVRPTDEGRVYCAYVGLVAGDVSKEWERAYY